MYSRNRRERRVGHDDVGLVEQRDALGAAEVAVPSRSVKTFASLRQQVLDVGEVDRAVLVQVRHFADHDLVGSRGGGCPRTPGRSSSGSCSPVIGEPE